MLGKSPRLLLCRPQGGLTDVLSRIGKCIRYADTFNRVVVVETDFSGAATFRDDFSNYFISHDLKLILSAKDFKDQLDQLSLAPPNDREQLKMTAQSELQSIRKTNFDFGRNHPEPLLVYLAAGGGARKAMLTLRRISLAPRLFAEVHNQLLLLGSDYTSIHIRHTDYTTDYRTHLDGLASKISGLIYLATDNREVLEYGRKVFGEERVFNFSTLPQEAGLAIHSSSKLDACQSNSDAICDLVLLASAKTYYYFSMLNPEFTGMKYSGYSRLASVLHQNKRVLRQFIDAREFGAMAQARLNIRKTCYRGLGLAKSPLLRS